jgi:hypothetical protein
MTIEKAADQVEEKFAFEFLAAVYTCFPALSISRLPQIERPPIHPLKIE